ncbi:50S ribosomal protein L12, apicoplast, putative [Plasmodium knowlesi strain H]|uniref:50S ribosomal protein L12, apicoplast, putative n=3 Tax=Plasmodium knowlesi TaxID=5850 RepID=A0A5K1UKH8_PLAKH|nr:50S ribosomal protein L12, apicoplast, putative [Plasmodium knowlesi strain H]OTN66998.1 putative 50S ribosomal protein L12 - apicoplast [Plasmodium knowlesi]CAA9988589.1 50S ribosomal protein L12, apicoplast, putative [Plasmodium knowlesi strain H]SBO21407.1 50S ribosomal protein L12, apicoplast, putative [Plasmodium knowlesi strain H]SBO21861.1 50S ribosomal protein L12, apicoplast, putative [Plasmodium knowlesi strain H]VVS78063.1 50S ribosomal protein L12, apicoplast, putative [Plasmodi|eukprot:XP_002259565.1 50S ribosomal subunit protein L12, putative [Plasmodium knowlesi strain H]
MSNKGRTYKALVRRKAKVCEGKRTKLRNKGPGKLSRRGFWFLCLTYVVAYFMRSISCLTFLKRQRRMSYIYLIYTEKRTGDNLRRKNYLNYKNGIILKKDASNGRQKFTLGSEKVNKIIESLKELTLLEASELVKQIETTFSVDTRQSIGSSNNEQDNKNNAGDANANEEENDENKVYDLILENIEPNKKIPIIKIVKEIKKDLNLKQAKDLVDNLPQTLFEKVNKETADKWKAKLTEAGGIVKLK